MSSSSQATPPLESQNTSDCTIIRLNSPTSQHRLEASVMSSKHHSLASSKMLISNSLSSIALEDAGCDFITRSKVNNNNNKNNGGLESKEYSEWICSPSKPRPPARRRRSFADIFDSPKLDFFLNWTSAMYKISMFVVPILWIISAVFWILYLRNQNQGQNSGIASSNQSQDCLFKTIASRFTVLTIIVTIIFIFFYVIKTNWAFTFEFIPSDDPDYLQQKDDDIFQLSYDQNNDENIPNDIIIQRPTSTSTTMELLPESSQNLSTSDLSFLSQSSSFSHHKSSPTNC